MTNINERRYPNIEEAVAFRIAFSPMLYSYGDTNWYDIEEVVCSRCGITHQVSDFLAPKSACKKEYAILDTYHYGVSNSIREALISNFDITNEDFRPIRNKTGEIVFYQIEPCHTMLPVMGINRIRELKPCKKCGSIQYRENKYKNERGNPYAYINAEILNDLSDLNVSFEKYEMFLPWYVVSRRVYDFLSCQYPRMTFIPLFLKRE